MLTVLASLLPYAQMAFPNHALCSPGNPQYPMLALYFPTITSAAHLLSITPRAHFQLSPIHCWPAYLEPKLVTPPPVLKHTPPPKFQMCIPPWPGIIYEAWILEFTPLCSQIFTPVWIGGGRAYL